MRYETHQLLRSLPAAILVVTLLLGGCTLIRDPDPEDCVVHEGRVTTVEESARFDVRIVLESESGRQWFYINRGLEQGLTIEQLREDLYGAQTRLHVVRGSRHIAQMETDDEVVFTEFTGTRG